MTVIINPVKKINYFAKPHILSLSLSLKMTINKSTYFSFFFLICFLASFSAIAYKNINTVPAKAGMKNLKAISFSSKQGNGNSSNDFLYEENEVETGNDFQAQIVTLPFFVTYFQYELFQTKLFSAKPFAEKITNPIYIEVCNFRI
jgi:hypothetical protein